MTTLEAAEERVQQTSCFAQLALEHHKMAQDNVHVVRERDSLARQRDALTRELAQLRARHKTHDETNCPNCNAKEELEKLRDQLVSVHTEEQIRLQDLEHTRAEVENMNRKHAEKCQQYDAAQTEIALLNETIRTMKAEHQKHDALQKELELSKHSENHKLAEGASSLRLELDKYIHVVRKNNLELAKMRSEHADLLKELKSEHGKSELQLSESLLEIARLEARVFDQDVEIERMRQVTNVPSGVQHSEKGCQVGPSTTVAATQVSITPKKTATSSVSTIPVPLSTYASPIPQSRMKVLSSLPSLDLTLPEDYDGAFFTRFLLTKVLGGAQQSLIVRVTNSATDLAREWQVDGFLCPNMDHNPWCPVGPGKHGFMQVGLGREKDTFNEAEVQHIFVGAAKKYRYCGKYEVSRVARLTVEEWNTLPETVKKTYSQTTLDKEKPKCSMTEVRRQYESGERLAPCVLLRCIEFDPKFWNALVEKKKEVESSLAVPLSARKATNKRKRSDPEGSDCDDEEPVTSKDPRTIHMHSTPPVAETSATPMKRGNSGRPSTGLVLRLPRPPA